MGEIFGVPTVILLGQVLLGLINGSFYAVLSLGLAIIFGMLNVINFAHGAFYMSGAFVTWLCLTQVGLNYWMALLIVPLVVGACGVLVERLFLRHLARMDHLYSLLFTFGLALAMEGLFRYVYGAAGKPYPVPEALTGLAGNVWTGRAGALLLVAALLLAPALIYPLFLISILTFVLFASALNLVLGYAALLSLGHAAFFGGAAYVTAHSAKVWGLPFELAVLLGTGFATLLGLVFGVVGIRRHGIYFAMITLALAQMIYFLAVQMPFTNGEDGIQAVPRGHLLGLIDLSSTTTMYYVVLGAVLIGLAIVWRAVHSPFGHVLAAIRENEPRAVSLGLDVARYKLIAFVLSAALSGLAGSLKVIAFQLAALNNVSWHLSGEVELMTLIGGMGTFAGPIIGSAFVVALEQVLATSGLPISLVVGVIFMACVMTFRRGVYGETRARFAAMLRRHDEKP